MNTKLMIENKEVLLDRDMLNLYLQHTGNNINSINYLPYNFIKELDHIFYIFTDKHINSLNVTNEEIAKVLTEAITKELIFQYGEDWINAIN